ncbi:MAG: RNA polymerase factor sigma-54 [Deltaproteobacteria bacterium]|nr:RNA polymerase factor sigma-54 [Deltaproteobacteria bacterium]
MNMKLQMRMSQQLIMTPQLQQAIKLLQLSRTELEELIDQALIENPVLEESREGQEAAELERLESHGEKPVEPASKDSPVSDMDWEQYIESGGGVFQERYSREDGDEPNLEATLANAATLQDHLLWQLEMSNLSPVETAIGEHLIGNLDDDGYLTVSIAELIEMNPDLQEDILTAIQKGAISLPPMEDLSPEVLDLKHIPLEKTPDKKNKKAPPVFDEDEDPDRETTKPVAVAPQAAAVVESVIEFIQTFDPTGVGARTLQECLEIQLIAMGMGDMLQFHIVHNDLKLLENRDLKKVARRHKVDLEEVLEAYRLIMALEPKPGRPFGHERPQHIIPDVYIFKFSSEGSDSEDQVGQYRVMLNETGLPRLRINNFYKNLGEAKNNGKNDGGQNSLTKEYIQEKIKAGNWLMKSIEQRQKTILRVTKSILKHQYEFFENGINYLKPLVLKAVADDIEVHESTVSRITTNKYAHTPQGIFELKYFFTSGIDQGQGEVISSKKIKDKIQKIIEQEDNRDPLTDIQIADWLYKESKIKVARRTVAKYREALNLLPSNRRKQMF